VEDVQRAFAEAREELELAREVRADVSCSCKNKDYYVPLGAEVNQLMNWHSCIVPNKILYNLFGCIDICTALTQEAPNYEQWRRAQSFCSDLHLGNPLQAVKVRRSFEQEP
jgi:hypothetical protein